MILEHGFRHLARHLHTNIPGVSTVIRKFAIGIIWIISLHNVGFSIILRVSVTSKSTRGFTLTVSASFLCINISAYCLQLPLQLLSQLVDVRRLNKINKVLQHASTHVANSVRLIPIVPQWSSKQSGVEPHKQRTSTHAPQVHSCWNQMCHPCNNLHQLTREFQFPLWGHFHL